MRRRSKSVGTTYTYTVFSNCNGGTVYFDDVVKGRISNGTLIVEIVEGNPTYTVRIGGGVPGNSENTETERTSGYDFSGYTDQSYPYAGGSSSFLLDSSGRDGERIKYNPYSYSSPSNATIRRDSSLTMNYSGPNYGTPYYGDWNWGNWYRVGTNWQYNDPSWVSRSASNEGSYNVRWNFNCQSNPGTARSDYDFVRQDSSGNSGRVSFSQAVYNPPVYSYKVYSNCNGASVYFDGTYKGTISGGQFSTNITNGDSYYNVTLSGGVPGTSYGSYTYTYVRTPTLISSGMPASGGNTGDVSTTSYKSRTNVYYDSPSGGRVNANSYVTLDYGSHSGVEQVYVSWFHTSKPTWLGYTTRTSGTNSNPIEKGYYTFAVNSGASRSFDVVYKQEESGKSGSSSATQVAGRTDVFVSSRTIFPFTAAGSYVTSNVQSYWGNGTTVSGRNPWSWSVSLPSWITANYTVIDNGTTATGTSDKYTASANTSVNPRSYNSTMIQENSGKRIDVQFTQPGYLASFTVRGSGATESNALYITKNGAATPTTQSRSFILGIGSTYVIDNNTVLTDGTQWSPGVTLQFWRILGGIIRVNVTDTPYDKSTIQA